MIQLRMNAKGKSFSGLLLFVILLLCPVTSVAEEAPATEGNSQTNNSKCGCDGMYLYDAVRDRCLINFKKVMKRVVVTYNKQNDVLAHEGMAKSIYIEGEKIFKGIMISVLLFMTCASICVVSACIYCCRINYTDRTLNKDVKALAKKLKRNYNSKKMAAKRTTLPAQAESCNVIVEPAGVFMA